MNIFELMDLKASTYSKNDRRIYEGIRKFPDAFASQTITEITEKTGFSKPALSRFAQKLGFGGYAEFQYQFSQELKNRNTGEKQTTNADVYASLLKEVSRSVDDTMLMKLTSRMRASRRVCIFGTNLSRLPAEALHITLQFQKDILSAYIQRDTPPVHHHKDDMYIIYSAISGDSHQSLMKSIRSEPDNKPYLVLITTNAKHPLRHNFDEVITLPSVSLASGNHIVFSDTFAFMMFNDRVLEYLQNNSPVI